MTSLVELIRARAADPLAPAKPVETGESRAVRSLRVGLLPAGVLWLTMFSLLRGLLG